VVPYWGNKAEAGRDAIEHFPFIESDPTPWSIRRLLCESEQLRFCVGFDRATSLLYFVKDALYCTYIFYCPI
jgi:hypothetical protein